MPPSRVAVPLVAAASAPWESGRRHGPMGLWERRWNQQEKTGKITGKKTRASGLRKGPKGKLKVWKN